MCGNGALEGGEGCDDGNTTAGDGCDDQCLPEYTPACGDSILNVGEGCDDGNHVVTDACPDGPLGTCAPATCGDGYRQIGVEPCDDGNNVDSDGCSATCAVEAPLCGDGNVDVGETCDNGNLNSDVQDGACRTNCQPASCGDLWIDYTLSEECDDGNAVTGDGCDLCLIEAAPTCGDGTWDLNSNEQCDDGNIAAGDGCSPTCQFETVGATCGFDGDGDLNDLDPGELCDDGNTANADGCNPTCNLFTTVDTFVTGISANGTLAVDQTYLYIGDAANRVLKRVDVAACLSAGPPCNGVIIAGTGNNNYLDHPDGLQAEFDEIGAMASDGTTLWVAAEGAKTIRAVEVAAPHGVTTVAGDGTTAVVDGVGLNASFDGIRGLTYFEGYVYLVDGNSHVLRRFDPVTGRVVTLAGGVGQSAAVDGYGSNARFRSPRYIASDNSGNLFIADNLGYQIRSYNIATGYVGTFVGSGNQGYADGIGLQADLRRPRGVTSDGTSIYWAEQDAFTVRQAVLATAEVTTLAGQVNNSGANDSANRGSQARFGTLFNITFHYPSNSLFVYDGGNNAIRQIQ